MSFSVQGLFVHPVKSLRAQTTKALSLIPQRGVLGDRRFALARPKTVYDPNHPTWIGKHLLEAQVATPELAQFRADYADETLTVYDDTNRLRAQAHRTQGWGVIDGFFSDVLERPVRLIEAPPGGHLSDRQEPFISLITTASLRALEKELGAPVDPRRFRANLLIKTDTPFIERDWVGKTLTVGSAEMTVIMRIDRCCATHTHPERGVYDMDILKVLRGTFQRRDFGLYARVLEPRTIKKDDRVSLRVSPDDQPL
ncbi:MAG: MOSC domain-containing protein [Pseudomonadota bacterium]